MLSELWHHEGTGQVVLAPPAVEELLLGVHALRPSALLSVIRRLVEAGLLVEVQPVRSPHWGV
ncbi:hypothetical protein ACN27G_28730 [Plantactinospora sp. WMMB334]|uniref:hypothetical protein n=1 Tax=Plantactinospora sp. WMMB334 TaxID=3404119 RepID=UPI003B96752D